MIRALDEVILNSPDQINRQQNQHQRAKAAAPPNPVVTENKGQVVNHNRTLPRPRATAHVKNTATIA